MIQVLDHGYVKLVETWGSDEHIIEAARMSTDKGFKGWGPKKLTIGIVSNYHKAECITRRMMIDGDMSWECGCEEPGDEKLLKFLYEHKHSTPFEFAGMVVEIQAPIMVFREWHRHRTQSYAEMSARYTPLPDFNYVPTVERILLRSQVNKQASGSRDMTQDEAEHAQSTIHNSYIISQHQYTALLERGVTKEIARLVIPVGRYSRMRAAANLRNWLAFMTLRCDENAQWEIRQYANIVAQLITESFPRTAQLWKDNK